VTADTQTSIRTGGREKHERERVPGALFRATEMCQIRVRGASAVQPLRVIADRIEDDYGICTARVPTRAALRRGAMQQKGMRKKEEDEEKRGRGKEGAGQRPRPAAGPHIVFALSEIFPPSMARVMRANNDRLNDRDRRSPRPFVRSFREFPRTHISIIVTIHFANCAIATALDLPRRVPSLVSAAVFSSGPLSPFLIRENDLFDCSRGNAKLFDEISLAMKFACRSVASAERRKQAREERLVGTPGEYFSSHYA
jgi:hypothetical protein